MVEEQIDFLPLQAVRVRSNGKRDYDPVAKRRLVQLCLNSGASVSSMALKAGINANQLRKWIGQNRQAMQSGEGPLSAFVPDVAPVHLSPASVAAQTCQRSALLSAKLPNGTSLELSCGVQDAELVKVMIEALGGQR
ncbi:transposase [Cupriavidus sp. UYMSc13B]|nr:transposase [Cupriavidus sp. UYMSc13B]